MNGLKEMHDLFLERLVTRGVSKNFPNAITVQDDVIFTVACSHDLSAAPRIVRDGESDFAVEYSFEHKAGDVVTPIWRFYIKNRGHLVSGLNGDGTGLCDFDNEGMAELLLIRINTAVLASRLFAPAQPLSA